MDRYLTIEQAAAQLGMSIRYVRRLVAERRIAFHKYGRSVRLRESDVAAFAAAGRIEPITSADVWRDVKRVALWWRAGVDGGVSAAFGDGSPIAIRLAIRARMVGSGRRRRRSSGSATPSGT